MSIPFLERLGLTADADERAVRRAYARELKQINQEADPEGFQSLRAAYEHALAWARRQAYQAEPKAAPAQAPAAEPPTLVTEPATADEEPEDDPGALAEAVYVAFRQRCESIPAEHAEPPDAPWVRELEHSLDDPRLIGISAREIFEHYIAYLLAEGWQPGHEALLVAATRVFNWKDDRRRVLSLGDAGSIIDDAMRERETFDLQPGGVREEQRHLIERLRDPTPPGTRELAVHAPLLELLAARYPNWLTLITSVPNIRRWRQMNEDMPAWRRKLTFAGLRPSRTQAHEKHKREGKSKTSWVWLCIALLWALSRLASHSGHDDAPRAPSVATIINQGGSQLDNGDLVAAILTFNRALEIAPNNPEALAYRGLAHALNGELDPAGHDLDRAAQLSTTEPMLYRARGVLARKRKRYDDAIEAFTRCLQLDPTHIYTLMQRAYTYAEKADYDKALADADTVLKLKNGDHLNARLLRLYILSRQGVSDQAITEINASIAAFPSEADVYINAAYAYENWKRPGDAVAILDRGIQAAPTARLYMFRAFMRPAGDLAGRRSDFNSALSRDPKQVGAARSLAELEFNQHNPQQAIAILDKILEQPGMPGEARVELLATRAIMYDKTGKHAQAKKDIDAARQDTRTAADLNNLCWRLGQNNAALPAALDLCNAALASEPDDAAALDSKALILLRMGRYREAAAIYSQAIARKDSMAGSWLGRAIARHHLGDAAGSKADAAQARKIDAKVDASFALMGLKLDPA